MEPQGPQFLFSIYAVLCFVLLLCGLVLAFTPYLMRRQECFTVTIPTAANTDPYLQRLKRTFAIAMSVFSVVLFGISLALLATNSDTLWDSLDLFIPAAFVILLGCYYGLMFYFRRQVQAYKQAKSWVADQKRSVALVGEEPLPKFNLAWNLAYVGVLLLTLALGLLLYPPMPENIPIHADLNGTVTQWMPKGPGVILFPLVTETFIGGVMMFTQWTITRSRKWSDPDAPTTSALAYALFARAWSIYTFVFGLLLDVCIGALFLLSAASLVSMTFVGTVIAILVGAMTICAIGLSVVYGQAGSRVFKKLNASQTMPEDDDVHWKAGLFYVNKDDVSLFVPERFGIGWTLNLGRPSAWVITIAAIAAIVGFILLVNVIL